MPVVRLSSTDDPRATDYVALRESRLRQAGPDAAFIAEGELVIRRAVAAGYRPRSFLLAPRWVEGLRDVWQDFAVPVLTAPAGTIEALTGFHVHRGALASFQREQRWTVPGLLAASSRLVVVQDLVDHANLGAIARTTAALGWDGLLLSSGSADPLYRRAVKASMGVVLGLPWARADDDRTVLPDLRAAGFTTVALALDPQAADLAELAGRDLGRVAVLLGTEGHGLSPDWVACADVVAQIPMAAGVDSLNVAAAAAVATYVLR
ncbi:MAG: RNA methyltransferase [Actinomycetia bacterium]|nr:RNA methyltransferase [Actinomycetes bacterium]